MPDRMASGGGWQLSVPFQLVQQGAFDAADAYRDAQAIGGVNLMCRLVAAAPAVSEDSRTHRGCLTCFRLCAHSPLLCGCKPVRSSLIYLAPLHRSSSTSWVLERAGAFRGNHLVGTPSVHTGLSCARILQHDEPSRFRLEVSACAHYRIHIGLFGACGRVNRCRGWRRTCDAPAARAATAARMPNGTAFLRNTKPRNRRSAGCTNVL